jgi:hypothetical protein
VVRLFGTRHKNTFAPWRAPHRGSPKTGSAGRSLDGRPLFKRKTPMEKLQKLLTELRSRAAAVEPAPDDQHRCRDRDDPSALTCRSPRKST